MLAGDIPKSNKETLEKIKEICNYSTDLNAREIVVGKHNFLLIFVENISSSSEISLQIIRPLLNESREIRENCKNIEDFAKMVIYAPVYRKENRLENIVLDLLSGGVALFLEGDSDALLFDLRKWDKRGISEPKTEVTVRGSREGFIENFKTNIMLLRRRLAREDLVFETLVVGKESQTHIAICYLKNVAKGELVAEVKKRILAINIDGILESGYVEQLIEDDNFAIFPTVGNSEKPDKVCSKLLEGRVALICDNSPFVLTVPYLFVESFQCSEDYYSRPFFASLIRILRILAFFIATCLPALYVAIVNFQQELIPFELLVKMVEADSLTPFPAGISTLAMLLVYEMLREGGIRLPQPAGHAVGIVGALVIGDAVVSAGLIPPTIVIVVALSAIASFLVNSQLDSCIIMRYFLLILSSFLGLFGILIGFVVLLAHLISLKSFGVSYLMPFAPFEKEGIKDTFIRLPWVYLRNRNKTFTENIKRQGRNF